ncbi:MAG TPA: D-alanyl-D-alanine carboxypeptidase/D-alanyl-D-alanine-endopeptidase [Pyrinomonadaceae bacterium]|nr:D-alanyl-D-alanine carboxypeptidase/D-alanyl-D-alanine-endopeptidase [Pyrinomonadaceae bacterium]
MIKKNRTSPFITTLLFLALCFNAFIASSAQDTRPQRERRVVTPAATQTPTPKTTPTPLPQLTPTPDAATAPTVRPSAGAPRTVDELRTRIQEVLRNPDLAAAQVAVKVASLDTGRTIYEENAEKLLHPASNMKIYTMAAALDRLTPDFRFKTSAYTPTMPDSAGTIRGDLIIYGRGDPSFAASFNNGDYYKAIDDFAARIAATGVKRVEGNIVGDESYFTGGRLGYGWEWDDLQWYYGAEISALTVNDNSLDLFVKPGASVGSPAIVSTGPVTPLVTIVNRAMTGPQGTRRNITVVRPLGSNTIEVSGSVPLGLDPADKGVIGSIAVPNPALVFVYMLRSSLAAKGVTITGQSLTIDARGRNNQPLQTNSLVELASVQSPPLSVIAAQTLKPSQNLYTELILRTLGKTATPTGMPSSPERTTTDDGIDVVKTFLRSAGIEPRGQVVQADGSGLSRHNYITAAGTTQLLIHMSTHRYASVFRDALPIGGVDGTLRTRLRGTPAAGNLRAKTGTISGVASLSGYVTSAAGERLVFSIILNNYPEESSSRRSHIDAIAVLLASFLGRS